MENYIKIDENTARVETVTTIEVSMSDLLAEKKAIEDKLAEQEARLVIVRADLNAALDSVNSRISKMAAIGITPSIETPVTPDETPA